MNGVQVKILCLEDNLFYDKQLLLYYKVEYPQFYSYENQIVLNKINLFYKKRAWDVVTECIEDFFEIAVTYYNASKKKDIPIRLFEIYYIPNITYNENCFISLYYDKYVYTGGAHGQTYRTSDSWNLNSGSRVTLCELFVNSEFKILDYFKKNIMEQIKQNKEKEEFMYFDDYSKRIAEYFDINNFYLTPEGVIIYFQQYDLAPYASGIPEFLIPYTTGIIEEPKCYK